MNRFRGELGAVELIVAFALVAILGFAALIVDIGNAKQTRRNFQTAADSGSLAGAHQLCAPRAANFRRAVRVRQHEPATRLNNRLSSRPHLGPDCAGPQHEPATKSSGAIVYVTTPYSFTPPAGEGIVAPSPQDTINVTICQTLQTSLRTRPRDRHHAPLQLGDGGARSRQTRRCPVRSCVMARTADPAPSIQGATAILDKARRYRRHPRKLLEQRRSRRQRQRRRIRSWNH